MFDLRERIFAEVDRREKVVRKATSGPWARDDAGNVFAIRKPPITTHVAEVDATADAEHVALHDPDDGLAGTTIRFDAERETGRHPGNPGTAHVPGDCCAKETPGMASVDDDGNDRKRQPSGWALAEMAEFHEEQQR